MKSSSRLRLSGIAVLTVSLWVLGCSTLVVTTSGCKGVCCGLSRIFVKYKACPHCKLHPDKCACRPDPWNHGYHPTTWAPLPHVPMHGPPLHPDGVIIKSSHVPAGIEELPAGIPKDDTAVPVPALGEP